MEQTQHHSPKHHIIGFIWSLLLTFAALWVTLKAPIPVSLRLTIIVILAILQFIVQLVYFMHISEGNDKVFQIINLLYGIFVAVVTVVGSIWIMLYSSM
ncbi:MAG: cytochrome aa3 quinol oxidase subunit IV [Thermoactinomyces sp.]